jgi:hypothetical protein
MTKCPKMYLKIIELKYLISNLYLVAYKLFLYKILINIGIEAHRNDGSVAGRLEGGLKFGHYWTQSGAAGICELLS